MSDTENDSNTGYEKLLKQVQSLEKRLDEIEAYLRIEWAGESESQEEIAKPEEVVEQETTESRIVEYGLAWLGSVVFFFGIIFLMSYIESLGYPVLSKVVAYLFTGLIIASSYFSRNSYPTLANVLSICSYFLLFVITLKLHFFSDTPLVPQMGLSLILVFIIIGVLLYNALKKDSQSLAVIAIAFAVSTAVISDSTYITFLILTLTAIASHFLFYKRLWWQLHIFSLFIIYLAHLLWIFSNPVMGHEMKAVESPGYNILFLFAYAIIYSFSIFIPKEKLESNGILISISIWNALGFSFLLLLITPKFYPETYALIFSGIAAYNIIFSVILKLKVDRAFSPATYASFGFVAISVAVYGFFGLPDTYLLLVLQSVMVVSLALWYRSRIIVVANAFLFISILLLYLIISESIDLTNFAFAVAALGTARILGWQKERLTLQTEIFRNTYLMIAVFMILYSLKQALPSQYVTLSWTATAIGFFTLSIILGNIKYRYLSIATIVVTGGHLFFIDLGQMDVFYRFIAFLVFAVITLGVSLYYTKRIRKKE